MKKIWRPEASGMMLALNLRSFMCSLLSSFIFRFYMGDMSLSLASKRHLRIKVHKLILAYF
ncbi:hypothetical protein CUJ86_08485 [Methanofollis fontis]|uniref:Uncharacterized protein n=1 Tax=Methanofollis fontis TaxID=2052832 RepID=A0A483CXL9_9EURY|nr:hypothetical protein CUJ86_08485 [Methanofollis fontis]